MSDKQEPESWSFETYDPLRQLFVGDLLAVFCGDDEPLLEKVHLLTLARVTEVDMCRDRPDSNPRETGRRQRHEVVAYRLDEGYFQPCPDASNFCGLIFEEDRHRRDVIKNCHGHLAPSFFDKWDSFFPTTIDNGENPE